MPRGRPKLPRDEQGNIIRQKPDSVSAPTATIVEQAKDFDKIAEDAKQEPNYKFHLDLCGQIFEGTGSTSLEALQAVPVPLKITTKGTLTITHGDKSKTLILLIPKIKRLFYPNFQSVIIKHLVYGL